MNSKSKSRRTAIHDLAVPEQVLSGQELAQVQGGTATNLNSSKSNTPSTTKAVIICQRCNKIGVDKNPCCPPPSQPNL